MRSLRLLAAGLSAAAATAVARQVLESAPPGGRERWTRTNHRDEPVSMLEGPAAAAGLVVGAVAGGADARTRAALVTATTGAAAFGVVDDLAEDTTTRTKGLRGHLGALSRGEVTTGGLKVLGIGTTALLAAAVGTPRRGGAAGHLADVVVNGALIAGTANLVNLLDLRPGRALKAAAALSAGVLAAPGRGTTGAVLGVAAASAPADLAERDMLGDGGANALGAFVGAQWAVSAPRAVRVGALAAVVGLTLASERVSFSAVIDRTPWLRHLDRLGRRPAAPAAVAGRAPDAGGAAG
ncbi:hypothetical protein [Isoptericola sediminis]|uniref:UDP-N-acetylmuramyl pentapeptide phosphotransferase/UDP-N-acetylglucosamine-1-phosphate transferase n=1 Tax=Isoptericola sediminis TaxID=2733572 RepID=A0A849JZX7_9MICO|nr:hypothetical protein [Isoptericola sediminis]NNU26388.1 hypothetical protein [Isoptericola sediminis]